MVPARSGTKPRLLDMHSVTLRRHHQAKQFKLNEGYTSTDDYDACLWGVCDARRSLVRLQQYLLDAFLRARIPVVSVSPFDFLISDGFELTNENYQRLFQHLQTLLANGFVPLLHGDVLLDRTKHWRIYSGDDLLLTLAEFFQPRQCVFLTSVKGVLRSDGSVIDEFYVDETHVDEFDAQSTSIDVTGSMQSKVSIASSIVRALPDCQVFIMQGASDDARQLLSSSPRAPAFVSTGSTRILIKTNKR